VWSSPLIVLLVMRFVFPNQEVFAATLCRGLGRVGAIAAGIIRDTEAAQATAQESERVGSGLLASVHAATVREGGVVLTSRESSLSTAVEATRGHASIVAVGRAHSGIGRGTSTEAGGESVGRLGTAVALSRVVSGRVEATLLGSIGSRTRGAGHRLRTHAKALRSVALLEVGIGHQSCAGTGSTTAKTADVLGKVVVVAALGTASPVTSAERYVSRTTTAHATATHVMVTYVVSRRTHHARVTIAVAVHRVRGCSHGGEGAAEAGSAALEVGEAA
jgi:hypothetical protein